MPKWSYALVFCLAVGVYLNTLENEFVFDDSRLVVNNKDIRALNLGAVFSHDVGGLPKGHPKHIGSYRPFTILSYAFNYSIGGLRAGGFHFVDIVLHGCCSLLCFLVCGRLLESWQWALAVAVLFALHPVHTEAVANITGRSEVLAACFFLLGLLAHMQYRETGRTRLLAAVSACYLSAVFSKESAITLLGAVLLYDWVFVFDGPASLRKPNDSVAEGRDHGKKTLFAPYLCLAVVAVAYLFIRHLAVGELMRVPYTDVENPMAFAPFRERWLTRFYLLTEYARLLMWPFSLSADYSFNQIPLLSIKDPRNLLTLLVLGIYFGLLYWSFEKENVLFFGLAFIAITFSLTANIFIPIGTLVGERLLYLLIGADYDNFGRHSPGLVLYDLMMEDWLDRGGRIFDFTIGDEDFKADFGTAPTPMFILTGTPTVLGRAARLVFAIREKLRRLRGVMLRRTVSTKTSET